MVGLYWLLVSIIPKAFEPIAQFVACEQEVRDVPKVWKKLSLEKLSRWKEDLEQVSSARCCCMPASATPLLDPVCADQAPQGVLEHVSEGIWCRGMGLGVCLKLGCLGSVGRGTR